MEVAKKHQDQLERLKKNVRNTYSYFQPNYKRFNEFRRFVFDTSLTDDDKMVLDALKKPKIEFNIGEAYISRLRGEFSKQQPGIYVTAEDGTQVPGALIQTVNDHLRHIIFEANKNSCEYQVYTDILSGGFSAIKLWTEYANSMSFNQVIKFDRCYDPTLVGFDPLARAPHKGDGRFCFELIPQTREQFLDEHPEIDLNGIDFTRNVEGFNWSYSQNQEDVLLICDMYEKHKKRKRIVELANGAVMLADEYEPFVAQWEASGITQQVPAIKSSRMTDLEIVCRYRFIENRILEYVETDYPGLPLIFVDGNSIVIRAGTNQGSFVQMTRPYIYHLKGLQQLKNFAGQTLANELENLVQHKFKVAKESLPDEQSYLDAYTNIQIANTLVYKAFKDNDPKTPVPAPTEIARIPPPTEVIQTFTLVDQMSQSILGSYDASLGINNNQLSGTAIVEGATQSNAAAMPYVVSYMQSLSHLGQMIAKMLPKYYRTPRTIPIVKDDGTRDYRQVNGPGQVSFNYDENALNVKVEAGVNFSIQKSRSLQQLVSMSQAMPIFGQFMNAKGLKVLIDNFDINGSEQLKELADQFMQELAQQQQMQQKMQQQEMAQNPMVLKAKNDQIKMALDEKQKQVDNQLEAGKLAVDKQQADTDFLKVLTEMHRARGEQAVSAMKAHAEETRAAVDLAIKHVDVAHGHAMGHKEHDLELKKHVLEERKVEHEMAQANKESISKE